MTFDPVASEIEPVNVGAMTEDIIPKKLKTPKVVPTPTLGAFSPNQEIMIGSTANFPKKPYMINAIIKNVAFDACTVTKSINAAKSSNTTINVTFLCIYLSASRLNSNAPGIEAKATNDEENPIATP